MGELSEKAFPFDSEKDSLGNNDREYFADDFARYFRSFISSGTFMQKADNLQVMANDDMTVTLRPGSMIIDGYKYDNVSDIIIPIEPADGVMNRIDRIAITWIKEERDIHVTIQKGQYSYTPIVPECRRTEEHKDYVVADIYIAAGAISITQDNITDQRLNTEVCGLAIAFCMIDTKMIFDQLQAFYQKVVAESNEWKEAKKVAWETWFANIKDQLSGDVAGNLQGQIGVLDNLETQTKDNLVEAINEAINNVPEIDTLDTLEEIEANTNEGAIAGALAVNELLTDYLTAEDGTRFRFGVTADGKPGCIITDKDGADTVHPFNKYSGDVTQYIRLAGTQSTYTVIAPEANIVWSLYGGGCSIQLDGVTKGATPNISTSRTSGTFIAKQGQVITAIAQYASGSYMNITEHFG